MKNATEKKVAVRVAPRNPTEAAVTCRPYASSGSIHTTDGVMRNFSNGGFYIETSRKYQSGTILIVRMVCYPNLAECVAVDHWPRSIGLAEVRWGQELTDEKAIRFGFGLKYLD